LRSHHLLLVSFLAACGLPLSEGTPRIDNRCSTDADCGPSGRCVAGSCVAKAAALHGLVIVIDVPTQVSYGGGARHVIQGSDIGVPLQGERESGFYLPTDLVTAAMAEVTATLIVDDQACTSFVRDDGAFPLQLELQPVGHPSGLGLQPYYGESLPGGAAGAVQTLVPAGRYDVYLAPDTGDSETDCAKPPFILYDRSIPAGSAPLSLGAPATISISGTILGYDASAWTVDLVENGRGRPVSTKANPSYDEDAKSSTFTIDSYAQVLFSEQKSAILRLQPPADSDGIPTVLWDAVAAFNGDVASGTFSLQVSLAELAKPENAPQPVELTVFSESEGGVPATVTIQAKTLYGGSFGGNLVYKKTFDTDSTGKLPAMLVPGVYEIVARPLHQGLAVTTAEKTITSNMLGSISLQLAPSTLLEGSVVTPVGEPAYGIPVVLQPPAPAPASYLQNQLSTTDLKLGGGSTITDGSGFFSVLIDPGVYDLLLQPDSSTNLPWQLLPRLSITSAGSSIETVSLELTHPAVLTGQVRAPSGNVIPGAVIRAFLPGNEAKTTVVQVGETIAGSNGSYRLLLPGT
jgi:hypothetical protein